MSNTTKATVAPRAAFAAKPISPLMAEYAAWLTKETGYQVDALSVQLSGVLRPIFQQTRAAAKKGNPAPAPKTTVKKAPTKAPAKASV